MISAEAAASLILQLSQALTEIETVDLAQAWGRVLATAIASRLDFPHWDNSAMDGYAVRWADVQQVPVTLAIVEEIPAGVSPQRKLGAGEVARIFTGAMLPAGADTIVIQENTRRVGNEVSINQAPQQCGEFVRRQGAFARTGQILLEAGRLLDPAAIAVIAAAQHAEVQVYRRPKVAIFSTGDELVTPDQPLAAGQIVDSNQYAIAALVQQWGGEAICLGIVPDRPAELAATMQAAIDRADLVLSTGGVSVGDYDYVDQVLAELGGKLHITAVAIKPGKPLTVATFERAGKIIPYFGLPGNPVSALVGCWRFAYLSFQKIAGISEPSLPWLTAVTAVELKADRRRESFLWGNVSLQNQRLTFCPVAGGHNSGNLINLAQANALALLEVDGDRAIGAEVPVLWLNSG
jgi:molybdopterin molybdotransferase